MGLRHIGGRGRFQKLSIVSAKRGGRRKANRKTQSGHTGTDSYPCLSLSNSSPRSPIVLLFVKRPPVLLGRSVHFHGSSLLLFHRFCRLDLQHAVLQIGRYALQVDWHIEVEFSQQAAFIEFAEVHFAFFLVVVIALSARTIIDCGRAVTRKFPG